MKFKDYWKLPENTKSYFSAKKEKHLKEKYGKFYTFHTILSIIILIAPFIIYMCIAPNNAFEPTTQIGNLFGAVGGILGLIGSFLIGIGFVNVFMLFIKQYLGHWVTIVTIIGGAILDGLGLLVFKLVE